MPDHQDQTPQWSLRRRSPKALFLGLCAVATVVVGSIIWAITSSIQMDSSTISQLDARYFPQCASTLSSETIGTSQESRWLKFV